jgi:hypothetical protein
VVVEKPMFKEVVEMLVVLEGGGGRTSLGRDGCCIRKMTRSFFLLSLIKRYKLIK